MKKISFKIHLLVCFAASPFFTSCQDNTPDAELLQPNTIQLEAYLSEKGRSRAYWDENTAGNYATSLAFHWEADASGNMKTILKGKDKVKPFANGFCANTFIEKTENRLCAHLSVDPLSTNRYEDGDSLFAYYPLSLPQAVVVHNAEGMHIDYTLPQVITDASLNSTAHLEPYILMRGTGEVKQGKAQLQFKVLPAILRFHVINSDEQNFTLKNVSLAGRLSTMAQVNITSCGAEQIVYKENPVNEVKVMRDLSLLPAQGGNLYALLFPITFNVGEELLFNLEGVYADGWTATYKDIKLSCSTFKNSQLESNTYYWVGVEVYRDYIEIKVNNHTITAYNKAHEEDMEIFPVSSD